MFYWPFKLLPEIILRYSQISLFEILKSYLLPESVENEFEDEFVLCDKVISSPHLR